VGRGKLGKNKRGGAEYSALQELKHENRKLRNDNRTLAKQLASLRKQLSRVNPAKLEALEASFKLQSEDNKEGLSEENLANIQAAKVEELKRKWKCRCCEHGVMYIKTWDHPLKKTVYWRECDKCPNKTRMQPMTDKVTGLYAETDAKKDKDGK
jgi:Zn finger protein HypA/HybF involved in hydrogenase expression